MFISVIIPTYNRSRYLDEALLSFKKQIDFDIKKLEIIIVNDGGTDNTDEIIEKWKDVFDINYIKIKHSGVCITRNLAIKKAKYDTIVFFDDDAIASNSLFKNIEIAMQNEKAIVMKISPKTDNIWKYFAGHYNQGDIIKEATRLIETVIFKKEIFDNVGYLNENIDYGSEGEEFFYRLKNSQYKLMYYPNIEIYHDYSDSIYKFLRKQYKFGEKMLYVKGIKVKSVFDLIKKYRKIKFNGVEKANNKDVFLVNSIFKDITKKEKIYFIILSKLGVISNLIGSIVGYYKYKNK